MSCHCSEYFVMMMMMINEAIIRVRVNIAFILRKWAESSKKKQKEPATTTNSRATSQSHRHPANRTIPFPIVISEKIYYSIYAKYVNVANYNGN